MEKTIPTYSESEIMQLAISLCEDMCGLVWAEELQIMRGAFLHEARKMVIEHSPPWTPSI